MENSNSVKYQLNAVDAWKIFRGFLVVLGGAVLTYASTIYLNIDYSFMVNGKVIDLAPLMVPVLGSAIELARRYITNYNLPQ
jgi:hypothetical protein